MSANKLTPKERQIMDLLFASQAMSVGDINKSLQDGSSYSSTRASLTRLVDKGLLRFTRDGVRYLFSPVEDVETASRQAIRRVIDTFFRGSPLATIDAVLKFSGESLSADELKKINKLLDGLDTDSEPG
ncbi:MAG: BlaI/MecI/CopY family transcriptional regulator [Gammaproteobacteria bacterium]|nr:BlaI/MecI/CopY family transcriptional regulator [Gammaproteobacteria bacterium]